MLPLDCFKHVGRGVRCDSTSALRLTRERVALACESCVVRCDGTCPQVHYFQQLVFTTLFPIGLGVVIWIGSEIYGRSGSRGLSSVRTSASYMLLLLSFVVLPSCSLTIFTYFGCVSYDLGDYEYVGGVWEKVKDPLVVLRADATIECYGPRYNSWGLYVGLMIAIYPVGEWIGHCGPDYIFIP